MNSFLQNLQSNDVTTENGMTAHSTTDSKVLDLFALLGTRPDGAAVAKAVSLAWGEDKTLTMKALFQSRDVRGGKGERDSFRAAMQFLADTRVSQGELTELHKLVPLIPKFGRWDDLHCLLSTPLQVSAAMAIRMGLQDRDRLCAKWQPRQGDVAEVLRKYAGLTPKQWRKMLVGMTNVVESDMCAQRWGAIDFSKVPSQAGRIYSRAFARHEAERYAAWKEALKKPGSGAKINVAALYPHEVVAEAEDDSSYPFEQAWEKMLEGFPATDEKILTVCDTSGSMAGLPLQVCVSLGLFFSQRNTGPFKDCFVTFSERPTLQRLTGTLRDRLMQLERAHWDGNTNLEAVFALVVRAARSAAPEDVPRVILVISDMQFDQCARTPQANVLEMYRSEFARMGVPVPKIVFWTVTQSASRALPTKANDRGVALLSGFSPNMLKVLLGGTVEETTPYETMLQALNAPRYEEIKIDL